MRRSGSEDSSIDWLEKSNSALLTKLIQIFKTRENTKGVRWKRREMEVRLGPTSFDDIAAQKFTKFVPELEERNLDQSLALTWMSCLFNMLAYNSLFHRISC